MSHSEACVAGCVPLTLESEPFFYHSLTCNCAFVCWCSAKEEGLEWLALTSGFRFLLQSPSSLSFFLHRYVISNLWSMVVSCPDVLDARVRWFAFSALLDRARTFTVVFAGGHCSVRELELTSASGWMMTRPLICSVALESGCAT